MRTGYELARFERLEKAFFDYVDDDDARGQLLDDLLVLLRRYRQEEQDRLDWVNAALQRVS